MFKHNQTTPSFLRLIDQIIHSPSVVLFLVESGFLCRMVDIFSDLLKKLGVESGADLVKIFKNSQTKRSEFLRVLEAKKLLCSCLRVSLKDIKVSSKFRSRLIEAGKRLVQFCFDFDDMQPSPKIGINRNTQKGLDCLVTLYESIVLVCSELVKWLIFYDEIAVKTLESFLERFVMDIEHISEENSGQQITLKLFTYSSVEVESISIFNLSHRIFIDIFMDCYVKGT
ncbi:hypothetical protein RF11_06086 [Thelohanellus kitauei]|uniref:Uncharacterized protein n=1 Tax=Thelohanellus kitauei TaxID=669202 RepID=A0A0C2IZW5_THEKT|nr:hypothetical protein RF11_06086 [Thelohanellus kitauei]